MTVHFVSVVGADTSLLDAAIEHYYSLGVEYFHIVRHVESLRDPSLARSEAVLTRYGLDFAAVHQGPWDEDLNSYLIRAQMRRHPNDWWVVADLDEFHVYGRPLAEIIDMCESGGYDYVRGAFLDRVAADGTLTPVDPAQSIWEQYEFAGLVTLRILKAVTSKVTLVRGYVLLNAGQHWAMSGRPLPWGLCFGQVHHFKWTDSVVSRLRRRVHFYDSGEWHVNYPAVIEESRRILKHIDENDGRIDVGRAELVMHRCGSEYRDYEPWRRFAHMLSLRNGLTPETAPTEPELERLLSED